MPHCTRNLRFRLLTPPSCTPPALDRTHVLPEQTLGQIAEFPRLNRNECENQRGGMLVQTERHI